MSSDFYPQT